MMTPGPSWRKSLPLVGAIEKQSVAGRPEPLRDVHDLELDPVGVVEEAGVVAGAVVVLLRVVLGFRLYSKPRGRARGCVPRLALRSAVGWLGAQRPAQAGLSALRRVPAPA